jgi:hypothetical protein
MTLAEALAIAAWAKPHRQPMDKLQRGNAAAQHVDGVNELAKRFAKLGSDISDMTKQLSQLAADLDHVQNNPGEKRIIN